MRTKKIFWLFTVLLLISCSLTSTPTPVTIVAEPPTELPPTPTARIEVIYRSPEDMNLRQGDLPELAETEPEEPLAEPVLPEALDQSLKTFTGVGRDLFVETLVIQTSAPDPRPIPELADTILKKRWPTAVIDGDFQALSLGSRGQTVRILERHGVGHLVVFVRSNIITIVLGCGKDADFELLQKAAVIIDGRIISPPRPEELARPAASATPTVVIHRPTPTEENVCIRLGLTAEECANVGTHKYQITCVPIHPEAPCVGGVVTYEQELTVTFSADSVRIGGEIVAPYPTEGGTTLLRKGLNQFQFTAPPSPDSYWLYFTAGGMTLELFNAMSNSVSIRWECERLD